MKLKLDENGNVVVIDGKPVYVHDDGKEVPFDAAATVSTISRLNNEAKTHREGKESAESKLAKFSQIEDVDTAIAALNTVKNLDDKKLVDAGKVEEIKAQMNRAWEEKLNGANTTIEDLNGKLHKSVIGGAFSRSKFISEKAAVPPDMIEAMFGKHFKLDDKGNIAALGHDGSPVLSRSNPGNAADFDEAIETLIGGYQHKDKILKSDQRSGNDTPPGPSGTGANGDGPKTVPRSQFDKWAPADQMKYMTSPGHSVSEG